ncbi:ribosome biogenesis ATPase RIX7 [Cladochytrium replicatum]|nr:ribosome biogenesis ATPase RIX7 [Cladochytrium replicatum]
MGRANGRSLEGELERRLSELIGRYHSETAAAGTEMMWNVEAILGFVQIKEPGLRRKPGRNVRKAIEAAIRTMKQTGTTTGSEDAESEMDVEPDIPIMEVKDQNHLNRSMHRIYAQMKDRASEGPGSEADGDRGTQAQDDGTTPAADGVEDDSARPKKRKSPAVGSLSAGGKRARVDLGGRSLKVKWPTPTARLSDLGGIDHFLEDILQLVAMPLKHPEIYRHLGIQPPRGILLHGPPGCGKTMLAHAIAGEANVPFLNISAPSVVSGMSGESEKKIREVFEEARELAPCLLFIDEIDAITPKRDTAQREMERRIVAQLLTCMDDLAHEAESGRPVMIIGATNRPDSLDPALRRAGRFDREIGLSVPDEQARKRILEKLCSRLRLGGDVDCAQLAKLTPGYVGADLNALTSEAGMVAVKRIFETMGFKNRDSNNGTVMAVEGGETAFEGEIAGKPSTENISTLAGFLSENPNAMSSEELEPLSIEFDDFLVATKHVQPSSKREGFATVPDTTWEDIGALGTVREELRMAVIEPIRRPELFAQVGITSPMGVLLYGPPGCGKTLLAKAVANESKCNFISVKGPELLNKYVGESERAIRQVFARAQASRPCIVFFDELDALAPTRSNDGDSVSASRLVNTLLTELDGMQGRKEVYVLAATNRPDMLDAAMIRPGRLDKTLYVDLPDPREREDILRTLVRESPLHEDLNLSAVATDPRCDGFSGADLKALVREAAVSALRRALVTEATVDSDSQGISASGSPTNIRISPADFKAAYTKVTPSVSTKDRKKYELLRVRFGSDQAT